MSRTQCANATPIATLLEYWLHELDDAASDRLDEHLLACAECSARLESLVGLAGDVRTAVRAGLVYAAVTNDFVQRLAAEGLRLREYRAPHNGVVHCTIAPDDDLLITRLNAPLAGIQRLDVERSSEQGLPPVRLRDVPFDPQSGEVVITPRMDFIRALPATTVKFRLIETAPADERLVGEYVFHHSPYQSA